MCLICIELQKNKLSSIEARRNLAEMHHDLDKDHILKTLKLIWEKEDREQQHLDAALNRLDESTVEEYKDLIDLWNTYGGD
jgi:TRAP-type uncharacterized transport system substrate-binding protein